MELQLLPGAAGLGTEPDGTASYQQTVKQQLKSCWQGALLLCDLKDRHHCCFFLYCFYFFLSFSFLPVSPNFACSMNVP
jgi:hypothetical protein